jgi:hypothetical protein
MRLDFYKNVAVNEPLVFEDTIWTTDRDEPLPAFKDSGMCLAHLSHSLPLTPRRLPSLRHPDQRATRHPEGTAPALPETCRVRRRLYRRGVLDRAADRRRLFREGLVSG